MRTRALTIILVLSALACRTLGAQESAASKDAAAWTGFQSATAALANAFDPKPDTSIAKTLAKQIQRAALRLSSRWLKASTNGNLAALSESYRQALAVDSALADSIRTSTIERPIDALQDLLDDLEAKNGEGGIAQAGRAGGRGGRGGRAGGGGRGAGAGGDADFVGSVKVTVVVNRNGAPQNGLVVRFNPRRYGISDHPLFPLNSTTSPAVGSVPPGNYIFWLSTAAGDRVYSQTMRLGADGSAAETITIKLP